MPGDARRSAPAVADAAPRADRRLAALTWPELEALLAAGPRVALVPLGATEQHGPHLPFATDTWIGDALAARLAARLPEAIACPTLPFGCSREHAGVSRHARSRAGDARRGARPTCVASLARHGFAGAFVFSAHGGNYAALAAMLPALAAAAAPMPVAAFTDLAAARAPRSRASPTASASRPTAAGHHAGEVETSILLALRPEAVRAGRARARDTRRRSPIRRRSSIRASATHAPNGTVGDPRGASATRADAYLDAWVDVLVDAYRRAKNMPYANGTQNA